MITSVYRGLRAAHEERCEDRRRINALAFWLVHVVSLEQRLITCYRVGHALQDNNGIMARIACRLLKAWMHRMGSSIAFSADIGMGLRFPHPFGIVVGEGVSIGRGVRIWQQVTLGSTGRIGADLEYPRLGDGVRVYAKATVIGAVEVGEDAMIAAHAVVLSDVPPGSVAAGIPARIFQQSKSNGESS